MNEKSFDLFSKEHEASVKLDYFICSIAGALFAYIGQSYTPHVFSSWYFLKQIENSKILSAQTDEMIKESRGLTKITNKLFWLTAILGLIAMIQLCIMAKEEFYKTDIKHFTVQKEGNSLIKLNVRYWRDLGINSQWMEQTSRKATNRK